MASAKSRERVASTREVTVLGTNVLSVGLVPVWEPDFSGVVELAVPVLLQERSYVDEGTEARWAIRVPRGRKIMTLV